MPLLRPILLSLALLALCGCAPAPQPALDPTPPASQDAVYRLASGDRLRILVFGQADLSNSYSVDGSGMISMPLIGRVHAQGQTTAELEKIVETRLHQGYLRDPSVSIEVESFRPYFVLGGVDDAGEYPYASGLTVLKAIAVAGGFSPRAVACCVAITRTVAGQPTTFSAPLSYAVRPGDTLTVEERMF
jgi:polysaccharide biosynthesis/export protein